MPSLFARLGRVAGRTVDAVYSEGFLFLPMAAPEAASGGLADVNARPVSSLSRPAIPFTGTWVAPGELMNAHGRTKADSTTHPIAGEKPCIDIADDALPQRPQEGDRIERVETGEIFAVAKVLPADFGRLRLYVTEARRRETQPR